MNDKARWEEAVEKLRRDTDSGAIRWETATKLRDMFDHPVGRAYVAVVGGKLVRIYEYEWQASTDDEHYYPARDVVIEFTDAEGNSLLPFPKTDARHALWHAVRRKAVGADEFLDRYLKAS